MTNKPYKTFKAWFSTKLEIAPTKKDWQNLNDVKDIIEIGWNARDELAKQEFAERDAEIEEFKKVLNETLGVLSEIDDNRYDDIPWLVFEQVEHLKNKIEELNQRGKDDERF